MINIWGQPLSASEKPSGDSIKDVKKIIEDEIAETLNLASVDPEEIVVFQDRTGKLKTSNVSLDDILTRRRDAADNSIALFQDGKLKPGALMSAITDKLIEYDKEFNDHVKNYNNFRKNVINKFFGSPIAVTPSLVDIKTSIESQEITTDIIKNDFSRIIPRLDKIKISHENFSNIVYTKKSGTFEWTPANNLKHINARVKGIYRLTLVSEFQFKISSLTLSSSVNNMIMVVINKDETRPITITSIEPGLASATMTWCMEFVAELK